MVAGKQRERFAQINSRIDRNVVDYNDRKFSFDNAFDCNRRLTTDGVWNSFEGRKAADRKQWRRNRSGIYLVRRKKEENEK